MDLQISREQIEKALTLEPFDVMAAHMAMLPLGRPVGRPQELSGTARVGAVLLLLYRYQNELFIALTKRRDDLNTHGGQISFPGGRQDEGERLMETAVRETEEEIGVRPDEITLVGSLKQVYIPPSDFHVHPFVGWVTANKKPHFQPSESEVSEIIEASVLSLLDPNLRQTVKRKFRGNVYDVPYFDIQGHQVWGATAVMLNEFIQRLKIVMAL
ncbi:MAG: CoA pyrophosphatase [Chloroflexota bacterium]